MSDDASTPVDDHYQRQAMELVDTLYDLGYFDRDVKREDMRRVEDLVAFYFQSQTDAAVRCERLLRQVRESKDKTRTEKNT